MLQLKRLQEMWLGSLAVGKPPVVAAAECVAGALVAVDVVDFVVIVVVVVAHET